MKDRRPDKNSKAYKAGWKFGELLGELLVVGTVGSIGFFIFSLIKMIVFGLYEYAIGVMI